jgi:hypothetical protein
MEGEKLIETVRRYGALFGHENNYFKNSNKRKYVVGYSHNS